MLSQEGHILKLKMGATMKGMVATDKTDEFFSNCCGIMTQDGEMDL